MEFDKEYIIAVPTALLHYNLSAFGVGMKYKLQNEGNTTHNILPLCSGITHSFDESKLDY